MKRRQIGHAAVKWVGLGVCAWGAASCAHFSSDQATTDRAAADRATADAPLLDAHGLALGREAKPIDEDADAARIVQLIEQGYSHYVGGGRGTAPRSIHGKQHGCVKAHFEVARDLPFNLRFGVFSYPQGTSFPAWVRFSNGNTKIRFDGMADGRGMAVKLMGVPGTKLSSEEQQTQDFLFQSSPAFFARDVKDYIKFMELSTHQNLGGIVRFMGSIDPRNSTELREVGMLAGAGKIISSPLLSRYWGALPARLGPQAVKLSATPCPEVAVKPTFVERLKPNYLREVMRKHLIKYAACFTISAQIQTDAREMPIEDATVVWDEVKHPGVPVAKLVIDAQVFDTPAQNAFCEALSFNPWHSLPEHQPLGGLNRLRKSVYETSSKLRHELNLKSPIEPRENNP